MLGRTKASLPVCTFNTAPPCAGLVPCMDCTRQRSSIFWARWGKSSLTQLPLSPYCWKDQGDFSRLPVGANWTRGLAMGQGLPWSRVSSGLGSNVSRCEGPPFINRKMTRLARAAKCGCRGARGLAGGSLAETDGCNSEARASDPKPTADCRRASRREKGRGVAGCIAEAPGGEKRRVRGNYRSSGGETATAAVGLDHPVGPDHPATVWP